MPICPKCQGTHVVKNGFTYSEKQNFKCRQCGRQFIENAQQNAISAEKRALVDKMLLEKLSLAAIARILDISESWLQSYVNKLHQEQKLDMKAKKKSV